MYLNPNTLTILTYNIKAYKNDKLSGVNAYLSALIVQDITGCNLNERYNLDWSTAEEFYNLWQDNNCQFK